MRIVVVGLGSIGRRHLSNLRALVPEAHLAVLRRSGTVAAASPEAGGADAVFGRMEEALAFRPDAALITGPASSHVADALALAESGAHLFIEKPLSDKLERINDLIELCRRTGRALMVGYNFRFYRPLLALREALADGAIGRVVSLRAEVGQYLPSWRGGGDYRLSVSARRELGGGAVLELSHEIDYVRWLLGEPVSVSAQVARLSDLEIDVEDTAEILLRFASGAMASLHLDMVRRPAARSCRIVGTEGTIEWDWESHRVRLFAARADAWSDLHPATELDRNEMYVEELRHFLECVRGEHAPAVGGEDGRRVVEIALAAKLSSEEGRVVSL
jgi:predicted dehydrogenase